MTKDQILTAIMHFAPGSKWKIDPEANTENVPYESIIWLDLFYTKPTEQELQKYYDLSQKTLEANTDYRIERQQAYPKVEDQLDMIFHEGVDVWKAKIQNIKNNFPKPT